MLTRKYYEMIAQTIKDNSVEVVDETTQDGNSKWYIGKSNIMYDLIDLFKRDNNNFDTQRFIQACKDD